jgi:hypothetical protein
MINAGFLAITSLANRELDYIEVNIRNSSVC